MANPVEKYRSAERSPKPLGGERAGGCRRLRNSEGLVTRDAFSTFRGTRGHLLIIIRAINNHALVVIALVIY